MAADRQPGPLSADLRAMFVAVPDATVGQALLALDAHAARVDGELDALREQVAASTTSAPTGSGTSPSPGSVSPEGPPEVCPECGLRFTETNEACVMLHGFAPAAVVSDSPTDPAEREHPATAAACFRDIADYLDGVDENVGQWATSLGSEWKPGSEVQADLRNLADWLEANPALDAMLRPALGCPPPRSGAAPAPTAEDRYECACGVTWTAPARCGVCFTGPPAAGSEAATEPEPERITVKSLDDGLPCLMLACERLDEHTHSLVPTGAVAIPPPPAPSSGEDRDDDGAGYEALVQRLAEVKIAGTKTDTGYTFNSNESAARYAAQAALGAGWISPEEAEALRGERDLAHRQLEEVREAVGEVAADMAMDERRATHPYFNDAVNAYEPRLRLIAYTISRAPSGASPEGQEE